MSDVCYRGTYLREILHPHPRLELHVLHVQVLGVGRGAVGELHLHSHHVGVGAERLPAEAVLHRQTLARDAVQQLVALQRAGGGDGLRKHISCLKRGLYSTRQL